MTFDRRTVVRPSAGRAALYALGVWAFAIALVLVVASDTEVGPVIFRINRDNGVHLGDLYAAVAAAVAAFLITVWIAVDHSARRRRWERARRRERTHAAYEERHERDEHVADDNGYTADDGIDWSAYGDDVPTGRHAAIDDGDPADGDIADRASGIAPRHAR